MTKTNALFLLAIVVFSCNRTGPSTTENTQSRPPTKEEIKAYLEDESVVKAQKATENKKRAVKIRQLQAERMDLMLRIQDKESKIERENQRLFRRILQDTIYAWIRQNEHDKLRIKEIDKQIETLSALMVE